DAVHRHEQLVEGEAAHAAHHPGEDPLVDRVGQPAEPRRIGRTRLGRALAEHPLAPLLVLTDEVAARVDGTPGAEVLRLPSHTGTGRHPAGAGKSLAPHADGVDLVDEDDALAAPLACELLRLAREEAHNDRVDADEGLGEAGSRDRDERRVEAGRDRLRQHRLAGTGRAVEEEASLALAAGALKDLAGLPERDDAAHLLLRLGLAADVVELDAPLRVAGLVAADLRDAHQEQW